MALIKCSECGKEISDKAKTCIHCGNPIHEERVKTMKKKTWEELTNEEKSKVNSYRKTIKQWWNLDRVLSIIFLLLGMFLVWFVILVNLRFMFSILGFLFLGLGVFLALVTSPKEQQKWYEKNIDTIYEKEILK